MDKKFSAESILEQAIFLNDTLLHHLDTELKKLELLESSEYNNGKKDAYTSLQFLLTSCKATLESIKEEKEKE